ALTFVQLVGHGGLDARDARAAARRERAGSAAADLAQAREDVALDAGEFLGRDLAKLETHLRLEQRLAQPGVVVGLGLGRRDDFIEDESQRAYEDGIEDKHGSWRLATVRPFPASI